MISDLLDKAADRLEKDGWTNSGRFRDPDTGCLCVIGAVRLAAGGSVREDGAWVFPPIGSTKADKLQRLECEQAEAFLSGLLALKTEVGDVPSVAAWNDDQTDPEAPITMLRRAANRARKEGR